MNKLKELLTEGWTISACYDGDKFYLVATYGMLDVVKTASCTDLDMAVTELYEKCSIADKCGAENKNIVNSVVNQMLYEQGCSVCGRPFQVET